MRIKALALVLSGLVWSITAFADTFPMYEGEVASNNCAWKLGAADGLANLTAGPAIRTGLLYRARSEARTFIEQECAGLYHGRFGQTVSEYFSGLSNSHCDTKSNAATGCFEIKCTAYAAGHCEVAGAPARASVRAKALSEPPVGGSGDSTVSKPAAGAHP